MSLIQRILHVIVLCGTCISPAAYGQLEPRIHVTIPFVFHVGEKEFPAGEYTVKASPGQAAVLLQSPDYSQAQFVLTYAAHAPTWVEQPNLVFNRYGTEYFLSTIWLAGSDTGRQLTQSRHERILAKQSTQPGRSVLTGMLTSSKR